MAKSKTAEEILARETRRERGVYMGQQSYQSGVVLKAMAAAMEQARAEGLEEAAKAEAPYTYDAYGCELDDYSPGEAWGEAQDRMAKAIRALADKPIDISPAAGRSATEQRGGATTPPDGPGGGGDPHT